MDNDTSIALKETLSLLNNKVTRNISIVTPATLGQSEFFHIAQEKFKELTPNVSKRAAWSEDNTIPRVHVSSSLLGCIEGYAALTDDITYSPYGNKTRGYRGGYYLYFIPFDYALLPNNKLVYDADVTGEHWLITYNQETKTYKPSAIGRIINIGISYTPTIQHRSTKQRVTLAIEIPSTAKLRLTGKEWLFEGHWLIEIGRERAVELFTLTSTKNITPKEFETYLSEHTDKLTLESRETVLKAW